MKGFKKVVGWGTGLVVLGALIGSAHHTPTATNLTSTPTNAVQGIQTESNTPASSPTSTQTISPTVRPTPTPVPAPTPSPSPALGNDNTYTNVDGDTIHSPAYSTDNSVPAGASAQCGDGTYSFSTHHSGTCSHHDGVARWL